MSSSAQGIFCASSGHPGNRTLYKRLLLGTALAALVTAPALANPTGGQVSTGAATISSSNNTTSVKQTSEGVVINWSSFNIGNGQTMQFYQPNAQALAVNRIGSRNASQILGTLDANGNVVLINGNGLLFGKNARVNVGSLVATSTDGTDSDLLSGKFTKAGSQSATIVNHGVITVGTGGTVALVAPNVTNTGIVNAKLGTISLGAANKFTVDLNGDGLVSFATQGDVNGKASVINRGRLVGANVSMTAHAAEGIATGVVNTSGVIVAQGAHEVGGTIVLDAGDGGGIDISGGKLEAKGLKGGGTITVGSWSDQSVTVNSGATLNASATKTGNGGHIQVVSNSTSFAGNALAQGGILSGNGGLIETSGHTLDFLGSSINASATHGKAGTWLLDPDDLTIDSADALAISNTLGSTGSGTNVSLQTTSSGCSGGFGTCAAGSGDINIEGGILWSSTATLSLDAWHSLNILAPIALYGAGSVVLQYNDSATDGVLNFGLTPAGFAGSLSFMDQNSSNITLGNLTINGNSYALVNSIPQFESAEISSPSGYIALANPYDASGDPTYTAVPALSPFTGTFEGLGNTISNFTLDDASETNVGLFAQIGVGGIVRDLAVTRANVTSTNTNSADVGVLAGQNSGTIINVAVSGSATDDNGSNTVDVGGLVGLNSGTISYSNAGVSVSGDFEAYVGGLVGDNEGTISYTYATGSVVADDSGAEGGLVGVNGLTTTASIDHSYATGAVGDPANTINADLGGLVGANDGNGSITYSYATGSVSGTDGNFTGGLVGYNNGGAISYAYAMGAVVSDVNAYIGGLIGNNEGSLTQTYSTGDVVDTQSGASVGGLIGFDGTKSADITSSYWDMSTSGIGATQGAGNITNDSGITGKTTANLQGTLPTGFDNAVWGTGTGLYPYFLWQYPAAGGTPQFISGTAYTDAGATIDADDAVVGRIDGTVIGRTSSGANGYYYFLVAPGSLSGTDAAFVQTASGMTAADHLSGSQAGFDIWGNYFRDFTAETTLSAAYDDVDFASGNNTEIEIINNNIPNTVIQSSASDFSLDDNLLGSGNNTVKTTAGDLTVTLGQYQSDGTVTLDSYGSIYVQAPIEIASGANLTLVTNDGGSGGNLDFQGGYANFESGASHLTIDGTPYTIVTGLPKLISDMASDPSGDFAFSPQNAIFDSTGTYTTAPIPTTFTGKLEGLGSVIDGLTISDTNGSDNVGLFANIGAGGSVENLTLLDESVTSASSGNIGGLAGANGGSVFNVYIAGTVTDSALSYEVVGGFIGNNSGTITGSGFDGAIVAGLATAGGFAGANNTGGTITTSYALGSISGSGIVAGFVNTNLGQVTNSYTTVAVTGGSANSVAGFAGYNLGTISNSYTASTLSGGTGQYGFVDTNTSGGGTITNSVWDEDTTGDHGTGYGSNTGTITGLTGVTSTSGITAYDESTYSGLGFTFGTGGDWYMIDGQTRPFLQAEYSTYVLNAHQLQLMAMNLTAEYELGTNITYDGTMWTTAGFVPIGTSTDPFLGALEGDGYEISNLLINRPSQDYVGIIGYAGDFSDITGVTIDGGSITGADYVGALAGYSSGSGIEDDSSATVTGAYNSTTLVGGDRVGGLIGDYEGSGFGQANASGNVSGNQYVGGAIGYIGTNAIVGDVFATGNVSGIEYVGGLAGYSDGEIEESTASGNVTAAAPSPTSSAVVAGVGGLVGVEGVDGETEIAFVTGNVSATGTNTNPARGIGGFAGVNLGEIGLANATGTVSGQAEVGGFAGYNDGLIGGVYSTGRTTGDIGIGGLVGYNDSNGEIAESYSLSAVSVTGSFNGHDGDVGGLVGNNQGEIDNTFSAGMVTCSASDSCAGTIGGFAGLDNGAIEATSYFDTYTSGIPAGHGIGKDLSGDAANVVGEGTATLQSGLPAGWDPSAWGIEPGVSYPYLQWQTLGGPLRIVSGLVQNASGTQNISGVDVNVLVDGNGNNSDSFGEGAMASGADGYYYIMLNPLTISSGSNVLAYITDTGLVGNTVETEVSGASMTNVGVHEGELIVHTSDTESAQLTSDLDDAVGLNTGAQFLFTQTGTFTPGAQITVFDSASSFNVNSALDFGTSNVDLMETGYVTENPTTGAITAADLSGASSGGVKLTGDNEVGQILGWTNNGGSFTFDDGEQLRIGGEIDAGANLTLTTTSGGINIDAELDAGNTISLNSAGAIGENATTGSLDAVSLNGSSEGGVSLQGTNTISNLNAFDTNGGAFNLDVDGPLRVGGEVQTGAGNLTLDSTAGGIGVDAELLTTGTANLLATGNISENASGAIDAARLGGGTLGGGVSLSSTNLIGELESFDTNGSGFSLTDGETLTTIGTLNAGSADVSLTTTSGDIDINGAIDAHRLDLNSHGAANESGHGAIVVQVLNVAAVTGIDLDSAQNDIVGVGTDTTVSGPNTIRKN